MANCPLCKRQALRHTLLADSLAALGCVQCKGVLLSLVSYRRWEETVSGEPPQAATEVRVEADDTAHVLNCPKCRGVMIKYRITSDEENRVDYCGHCEEIWLDNGEWNLVEPLARSGQLFAILTRPWQRRIVEKQAAEMAVARLQKLLGADFARFEEFRTWLDAHPERDAILAQLHHRS